MALCLFNNSCAHPQQRLSCHGRLDYLLEFASVFHSHHSASTYVHVPSAIVPRVAALSRPYRDVMSRPPLPEWVGQLEVYPQVSRFNSFEIRIVRFSVFDW